MSDSNPNDSLRRAPAKAASSMGQQDQPRKAPTKGRSGSLPYVLAIVLIVIVAAGAAIYVLHPSWVPFIGRPSDVAVSSEENIVFDGQAGGITGDQNNQVVQGASEGGTATVTIRSTRRNARPIGTTDGAYIHLKPELSSEMAGKRVRMTVWARQGNENPSTLFAIAYSNGKNVSTGWIAFDPTKEMKPYSFAYKVPPPNAQNSTGDYIGIWSDISGGGGGLEVRLITVRVLPPPPQNPS
jgi:hypothetical protein